jgi:hypothetical protein
VTIQGFRARPIMRQGTAASIPETSMARATRVVAPYVPAFRPSTCNRRAGGRTRSAAELAGSITGTAEPRLNR